MKSVCIRSFSGPYFPAFGLNTERYEYLSIFRPNAGKYKPEKLQIRALFTQCMPLIYNVAWKNNLTMKLLKNRLKRKTVLLNISVIKEAV